MDRSGMKNGNARIHRWHLGGCTLRIDETVSRMPFQVPPVSSPDLSERSTPPIVEAVVELRFAKEPSTQESMPALLDLLVEQFEQIQPIKSAKMPVRASNASFDITDKPTVQTIGYRAMKANHLFVGNITDDDFRFRFSESNPYSSWEEFSGRFLPLLDRFLEIFQPGILRRVGVRNVTRLLVDNRKETQDLLATPFSLPATLPTNLSRTLAQWVGAYDGGPGLIVTQSVDQLQLDKKDEVSVLIDIDVFFEGDRPVDPEGIRSQLSILRERKNEVFFGLLTKPAGDRIR